MIYMVGSLLIGDLEEKMWRVERQKEKWRNWWSVIAWRDAKKISDGDDKKVQSMNWHMRRWRYEFTKWFVFTNQTYYYILTIVIEKSFNQGWPNSHFVNPLIKVKF